MHPLHLSPTPLCNSALLVSSPPGIPPLDPATFAARFVSGPLLRGGRSGAHLDAPRRNQVRGDCHRTLQAESASSQRLPKRCASDAQAAGSSKSPAWAVPAYHRRSGMEPLASCLVHRRYLHDQGVAHRDLKPENILLKDTTTAAAGW